MIKNPKGTVVSVEKNGDHSASMVMKVENPFSHRVDEINLLLDKDNIHDLIVELAKTEGD